MIICKKADLLRPILDRTRIQGIKLGFVPTMGALHEGHLELVRNARKTADLTIASIFVNPTQFNDPADFLKYPVTTENDILMLEQAGVDILYLPSVQEIYSQGTGQLEQYDLGLMERLFEGVSRPGHFQGVCQVMKRLLEHVSPQFLFMGLKDYQQCLVIDRLLEILGMDIQLIRVATVREGDGLAMSSRNRRLSRDQREKASGIYKAMEYCREHLARGSLDDLKEEAKEILLKQGFRIDYLDLAGTTNLEPVSYWDGKQSLVCLVAAYLGEVRLIDNLVLTD